MDWFGGESPGKSAVSVGTGDGAGVPADGLRGEDWEADGAEVGPQPETSRGRHRASGRMVDAKRWRFLMGTPICCLDSGSFLKNSVWFTEG